MNVSVIVPTKNRITQLSACLNALIKQSNPPGEIIIVDNSSNKSAQNLVLSVKKNSDISIHYYWEKKRGSPNARNTGINKSHYQIVAFIDDDCIPDRFWIKEIIKAHTLFHKEVILGKNQNAFVNRVIPSVADYLTKSVFLSQYYVRGNIIYSNLLDTKNVSIKKTVLTRNKLKFDPIYAPYSIFEDIDFGFNVKKHNIEIVYIPKIKVTHQEESNILKQLKRQYDKGQALFLLNRKWKSTTMTKTSIVDQHKRVIKIRTQELNSIKKNRKLVWLLGFNIILWIFVSVIKFSKFIKKIVEMFKHYG